MVRTISARGLFSGVTHRLPLFARSVMRISSADTVGVRVGSGGAVVVASAGLIPLEQAVVITAKINRRKLLVRGDSFFIGIPFGRPCI
jgi:hypothetical protein